MPPSIHGEFLRNWFHPRRSAENVRLLIFFVLGTVSVRNTGRVSRPNSAFTRSRYLRRRAELQRKHPRWLQPIGMASDDLQHVALYPIHSLWQLERRAHVAVHVFSSDCAFSNSRSNSGPGSHDCRSSSRRSISATILAQEISRTSCIRFFFARSSLGESGVCDQNSKDVS